MKKISVEGILIPKRKLIIEIISALFILLFVYTALSKLNDLAKFKGVLSRSPLIGNSATLVSYFLPTLEIIVSLILFMPRTRKIGLVLATVLMTIFSLYIGYMILFTPDLPCSCGGIIKDLSWGQHLLFNIIFTLAGVIALWLAKDSKKKHPGYPPRSFVTN